MYCVRTDFGHLLTYMLGEKKTLKIVLHCFAMDVFAHMHTHGHTHNFFQFCYFFPQIYMPFAHMGSVLFRFDLLYEFVI